MNDPLFEPRRLVKRHEGQLSAGGWNRAHGLTEANARALAADLTARCFQVRHVHKPGEKWEVVFR